MAALDRRNPNLDDFVGLNWSCWVDRVNILPSDAEDSSKYGRNLSETMALRKEDMHTYGHCPAHDEIYLVVCSHCGQVVKPQAFEKHCERRHGPLANTCGQSSPLAPQQRPRPGHPLSALSSSRERQKDGRSPGASFPSSAASPVHQRRPTKAQQEAVSFPSVEKLPQENPSLPHHSSSSSSSSSSSTLRPKVPLWRSGPLPPGHCSSTTSLSERPSVQRPTAGQTSESHSPLRGTRTYSRIYKNIDKKECDLNKHCGVLDPERKKLCSPGLICNTDSIHQQHKTLGRTQTFHQLPVEQRTASASKDKEQHLEAFDEKMTTQGSKCNLISNCHILSRSREPSESFPEEEGDGTVEVEVQPPYPFNQNLPSSDESEDDGQEEAAALAATPRHPKPLGLCTFGCHTLGCSIFTFDRRWQHLQFALSAMLEHHVSTHLWKKMPQVSSGLGSRHVTRPVRTGDRPSKSTGSLGLESTSLGQLETKSSQHNAHITKPPSSNTSASLGPGRRRNPAGRPSKPQLRKVELMQDANTAQKAATLSHSVQDKSSKYVREPPLHEKGQPHINFPQRPVNGSFSLGQKPCPPLHRSRARPTGIQQKVIGCDHAGLTQKRKCTESPPLSSSLSRTAKCPRLSSPSSSSLFAWKGENIGDAFGAWRKDLTPKDQ